MLADIVDPYCEFILSLNGIIVCVCMLAFSCVCKYTASGVQWLMDTNDYPDGQRMCLKTDREKVHITKPLLVTLNLLAWTGI